MKHKKRYSVSMFWNKRNMDLKTKVSTIALTVNLPRLQFRVGLKLESTKADFDLALSSARKITDDVKALRQHMNDYLTKAETILERIESPTRESFVRLFKTETDLFHSNKTDVHFFYLSKMDELLKDGKIGTRKWFIQCRNCLVRYAPKVVFEEIDEKWLKDYHSYLKQRNNSDSTCAMKLRCLKIIFNIAKGQGFISEALNPFKHLKLAASGKSKAVLYPAQLKLLLEYQTKGIREARAKAYFFFCYLGNGMNFKDMTLLKNKDLTGDSFTFIREKTRARMKDGGKIIKVHLHDYMKQIILEHGNKLKAPDDYVFPVLTKGTSLLKQEADKWRHKRVANNMLTKIGKKLGFDVHLCINLARHSFATTLKLNGTPVSFISDCLGHSNTNTTTHYLKALPDENMRQLSNQLLAFV